MSWVFNPPPGWPPQPPGWVPPPGWEPDPHWPPAPAGWQFWVPAGAAPPQTPPTPATLVSPPVPAAEPATEPTPPYEPAAPDRTGGRAWFGRWWVLAGLFALLLVGSGVGYGGTRAALDLAADSDPSAAEDPSDPAGSPGAAPSPEPTETPGLALPTIPPLTDELCGQVALTMLTMLAEVVNPDRVGSLEEYQQSVADARRAAAEDLRALAGQASGERERDALAEFADEVEESAQLVEDNLGDQEVFEESFDQVTRAYEDFNDEHC